jgi:hypothetical protein
MRQFLTAALLAGAMALGQVAVAAENPKTESPKTQGKIAVELNDLQQSDSGCRAVFVLNNGLDKAFDKVTFRVVGFDGKGHATLFLSFDFGALPVGKTRILRFDLGDKVACSDVSRLVLDDVTACSGPGVEPGECLAAVALSTRASVPFDF